MSGKKAVLSLTLVFLLTVMMATPAFAGVTGKIAGVVKDSDSGDPLPGANIIIEGTDRGAAADADGKFVILNVPPGVYSLRVQMMGYTPTTVTDVRVFSDRTRTIEVGLSMTVIEGQEVTVVAGREVIEFDRTNTASYVGQEEIENMPVQTLSQVIQLQAGVIRDAGGGLHFRGGRSREVAYMIDGVPVSNSFSQGGGSNVAVENNMVKELQVITGTFNAEYGSAQSGVVNVVTKVPDRQFKFNLDAISGGYYAPNQPMYIGLDAFDPLNTQEYKVSVSGPIPFPKRLASWAFSSTDALSMMTATCMAKDASCRPTDGRSKCFANGIGRPTTLAILWLSQYPIPCTPATARLFPLTGTKVTA